MALGHFTLLLLLLCVTYCLAADLYGVLGGELYWTNNKLLHLLIVSHSTQKCVRNRHQESVQETKSKISSGQKPVGRGGREVRGDCIRCVHAVLHNIVLKSTDHPEPAYEVLSDSTVHNQLIQGFAKG